MRKFEVKGRTVIIVCPWGNPFREESGAQIRTITTIRLLSRLFNRICLITLEDIQEKPSWVSVYRFPSYNGRGGLLLDLNPVYYMFLVRLVKLIRNNHWHDENYVVLEGPTGILGALFLRKLYNIRVCYNAHNVEIERMNRESLFITSRLPRAITKFIFRISEKIAVKFSDCIMAISWTDKRKFGFYYNVALDKIFVVYPTIKGRTRIVRGRDNKKVGIVFHGSYKYLPNKEAIEIISNISNRVSYANFYIAGSGVPKRNSHNTLKLLGFVERIEDFLALGDVALVPITRGAGIKLKIVDYLSVGLPIITTEIGAEGLQLTNGKNVIIVKEVHENKFVESLNKLIFNPKLRRKIGYLGWKHAKRLFDSERAFRTLKRAL